MACETNCASWLSAECMPAAWTTVAGGSRSGMEAIKSSSSSSSSSLSSRPWLGSLHDHNAAHNECHSSGELLPANLLVQLRQLEQRREGVSTTVRFLFSTQYCIQWVVANYCLYWWKKRTTGKFCRCIGRQCISNGSLSDVLQVFQSTLLVLQIDQFVPLTTSGGYKGILDDKTSDLLLGFMVFVKLVQGMGRFVNIILDWHTGGRAKQDLKVHQSQ